MQLKRLYIKEYKILKDFTYEFPFDSKRYNNVIIGVNGSGKSTILEAIAEIFSCIVLNERSKFGFDFEYRIKPTFIESTKDYKGMIPLPLLVKISAEKNEIPEMLLSFNNSGKFAKVPSMSNNTDFIPNSIVIYYSGQSEILEELCNPHNHILSKKYREGNTNVDRDFFYFKPEHFEIILTSLLSFEFGDIPEFLKTKAKISGVQSIQIILQKPDWASDSIENFWGAKGEVRNFLDFLTESSASIEDLQNPDKSKSIGNIVIDTIQEETIIITIIDQQKLYEIRGYLIEERKLFEILNIMLTDGLLKDISFSLRNEVDATQNFNILSEGEQQAVTIKGLSEFLALENTLFLFDEPDTYMHPKWQRQLIAEIEESVVQNTKNEITYLIATHSPQILLNANPEKTYVKIIEDGQLIESTPKHYGREINTILYELMGVEERNMIVRNGISDLFTLIEEEEIEEAEKALNYLQELIGEDDAELKRAGIQIGYLKEDE